jgi:hypothetical protein
LLLSSIAFFFFLNQNHLLTPLLHSGPPSVEEVLLDYSILAAEFPNAVIQASTFDAFVDELQAGRSSLFFFSSNSLVLF